MDEKKATIFISNHSLSCETLIQKMDEWGIDYTLKNITDSPAKKKELQKLGVYGTPATFVVGNPTPILGCQIKRLKSIFHIYEPMSSY